MANRPTTSTLVKHIVWAFNHATLEERAEGVEWYFEAHRIAADLAERHGISLKKASLVISALSPATDWEKNVVDAGNFIEDTNAVVSTYGNNKRIAARALAGEIEELNGKKTRAFAKLIENPYSNEVVIDRHAISVALGHKSDDAERRYYSSTGYAIMVAAYHAAAKKLNLKASELQAIVWVSYRKR